MSDRNLIHSPGFVQQLVEVVRAGRELCVVVLRAQGGGRKDWYIAQHEADLETALGRTPRVGPYGYSDPIEVFATEELPYRTFDDDEWLRARAMEVIEASGEVVLACKPAGDPELRDVDGADARSIAVVDEWLREEHEGERFVGAHRLQPPGVARPWNPIG